MVGHVGGGGYVGVGGEGYDKEGGRRSSLRRVEGDNRGCGEEERRRNGHTKIAKMKKIACSGN